MPLYLSDLEFVWGWMRLETQGACLAPVGGFNPLQPRFSILFNGLQAFKVMQRTLNPQNRDRYPGNPPVSSIS